MDSSKPGTLQTILIAAIASLGLCSNASADGGQWVYIEATFRLSLSTSSLPSANVLTGYTRFYGPSGYAQQLPQAPSMVRTTNPDGIPFYEQLRKQDTPIANTIITSGFRNLSPDKVISVDISSSAKHWPDYGHSMIVVHPDQMKLFEKEPLYVCCFSFKGNCSGDARQYWWSYNPGVGKKQLAKVCDLSQISDQHKRQLAIDEAKALKDVFYFSVGWD